MLKEQLGFMNHCQDLFFVRRIPVSESSPAGAGASLQGQNGEDVTQAGSEVRSTRGCSGRPLPCGGRVKVAKEMCGNLKMRSEW